MTLRRLPPCPMCDAPEPPGPAAGTAPSCASSKAIRQRLLESYSRLLLSFEANQGQGDNKGKFLARGSGYTLFLNSNEAVLALRKVKGRKQKAEAPVARL